MIRTVFSIGSVCSRWWGEGGAYVDIFASHNALTKLTSDFVQSAVRHTACAHEHCLSWQALGTVNCNKNENCTSLCKEAALGVSAQIKSSSSSSAYALEECVIVLWRWTTHPLFCADFCWMCLGDWKTHGSEYYECSRYKENPDIVNQSQQAQAREALKKYLFYFERVGVSSYPCLSRIGSSSDLLRWDHWDAMCTWKPLSRAPAPASWALLLGKCSFSVMQDQLYRGRTWYYLSRTMDCGQSFP